MQLVNLRRDLIEKQILIITAVQQWNNQNLEKVGSPWSEMFKQRLLGMTQWVFLHWAGGWVRWSQGPFQPLYSLILLFFAVVFIFQSVPILLFWNIIVPKKDLLPFFECFVIVNLLGNRGKNEFLVAQQFRSLITLKDELT